MTANAIAAGVVIATATDRTWGVTREALIPANAHRFTHEPAAVVGPRSMAPHYALAVPQLVSPR